jgi:hypothetical protein
MKPEWHLRWAGCPIPLLLLAWGVVTATGLIPPEWLGAKTPFELFWNFALIPFLLGAAASWGLAFLVPVRCPHCGRLAAHMTLANTIRYHCKRCGGVHDTGVIPSDSDSFDGPGPILP